MDASIVRIAVPSPLYRTFDYLVPQPHGPLLPGMRIRVPFGRGQQTGVLLEVRADSPIETLRPIEAVLDSEPSVPPDLLELSRWAQRYYHHPPGEVFATLLPVLLRRKAASPRSKPSGTAYRGASATVQAPPPAPNPAQAQAVNAVCAALGSFAPFLLDGVTGSGKTEVYLKVVEAVLARAQQALVIVPEIGLTPQLLARFAARLSVPLAVLHSGLSDRERLHAWLAARSGQVAVVIGTRSAVFTPLANPGVIVIDEEHDPSLKQQDGFRYHARDLAVVRARQLHIPVVLGSATPSLESLLNTQRGRYRYLRLPHRAGAAVEPTVDILDLRGQPLTEGLSRPLLGAMHAHLERGGQVLLFLNRRGFAPTLICHECGWLSQCSHCDARLTLHLQRRRQICHHCGAVQSVPIACPECGSVDLRALGQGTERIERALQREFPTVGIARVDRDSTRRKGSLQALLDAVHRGERRILIGTQMLAKGHHFPDVTLVGIVDADQGLFGADFRASERMAQLILQVAGRAGRAEKPGVVIIQTHQPHHPLLRTLVSGGYAAFAAAALTERQAACLPPFTWQALLRADALDPEAPQAFLTEALELGRNLALAVELLGPVPAPMERRAGRYRAQLLVQAEHRQRLHGFLDRWVEQLGGLKTARKVRWSLDVDPQDLF